MAACLSIRSFMCSPPVSSEQHRVCCRIALCSDSFGFRHITHLISPAGPVVVAVRELAVKTIMSPSVAAVHLLRLGALVSRLLQILPKLAIYGLLDALAIPHSPADSVGVLVGRLAKLRKRPPDSFVAVSNCRCFVHGFTFAPRPGSGACFMLWIHQRSSGYKEYCYAPIEGRGALIPLEASSFRKKKITQASILSRVKDHQLVGTSSFARPGR